MNGNCSYTSYPKIWNLGHPSIDGLLDDEVIVEEKIDGSSFHFGWFDFGNGLELRCRSHGAQINILAPEKMFTEAVEFAQSTLQSIENGDLVVGDTIRCEYLKKPHHNSLHYDRIPRNHLIVFDINPFRETYFDYDEKKSYAERINLETVPLIYRGNVKDIQLFRSFLERESCLGGQKIEGVVIKNYKRFGRDGKALMGKFVSEAYKEVHDKEWRVANPSKNDVIQMLCDKYCTPARWAKSVIHLREAGEIENSPVDIGKLIKCCQEDFEVECIDEIREELLKYALPIIRRASTKGLPEWYKNELLKRQFE